MNAFYEFCVFFSQAREDFGTFSLEKFPRTVGSSESTQHPPAKCYLRVADWAEEAVAKAEILRLIYQGRFLHSNVTLGALGLPFGKTTVMHLVPRENLPEPNSQGEFADDANFFFILHAVPSLPSLSSPFPSRRLRNFLYVARFFRHGKLVTKKRHALERDTLFLALLTK